MAGIPDATRVKAKPFLITKDDEGRTHLALRETRYNTQGYPIVATTPVPETFDSAAAARRHAKEHFGAQPGEFATK
ncbi:MAG TPA: hypothetical protein VH331_16340 [Allosphingosinicella sp.]|jgi:hypothetical protein|nr:hypothetical protein [Allosphingosinicella sp.]